MTDTEIPARPASYDRKVALVLQGGGALGSYQAGVYEALSASPYQPDWVAGISIGAVNAAIIAGNAKKDRVAALRLLTAALKQQEVDQRIELDDTAVLAILDKQAKQRRESISQYEAAGREDLAATERFELALIQEFLPQALTEAEIDAMIEATLSATGATGMRDMGKVMAELRGSGGKIMRSSFDDAKEAELRAALQEAQLAIQDATPAQG